MRVAVRAAAAVALVAVGATFAWCAKPAPAPSGSIEIPDSLIMLPRPKLNPTLAGRILTHQVKPIVVRTVASPQDAGRVQAFCAAAAAAAASSAPAIVVHTSADGGRSGSDDSIVEAKQDQPPPLLPTVSGRYDGQYLTLWLLRSDDSMKVAAARLHPHFEFLAGQGGISDSSPVFREDRWFVRLGRQTLHCLPRGGAGGGIGALVDRDDPLRGALLTGGAALLACLT